MTETTATARKEPSEGAAPEATRGGPCYSPQCDIYETAGEIVLLCDLPGVAPADLELSFEKNELTLHGKVKPRQQPQEYDREEYGAGDFHRAFSIRAEVEATRTAAEYKQGVLTIRLPRSEKAKPRRIPIKAG